MSIKSFANKVINIGVKPHFTHWEVHLVRKLNAITLVAMLNMVAGTCFFVITNYPFFYLVCTFTFLIAPIVLIFNNFLNYVWGAYLFFIIGFVFFIIMNLRVGIDTYLLLFYFPVIISLIQLLGRKELIKHLVIISALCLLSISIIIVGFIQKWVQVLIDPTTTASLMYFNILLCIFTSLAFAIIVVSESINQERVIRKMLDEKEILLSEVFHRVKNNMNIVTSLLNLKKNMSDSPDIKAALDDCKNRIYSMALVHQKIFETDNVAKLNFKDYINDLLPELISSLGKEDVSELTINAENTNIDLSNAIPCGLILNEFITNSFKYAIQKDKKLKLSISLQAKNNFIELELRDNGPGLPLNYMESKNTLGIELIKSLCNQLNAEYKLINDEGVVLKFKFKQK